jgi:AraC family transcriptional regulator, regulatory protein of adaptative response / methylated-DNA-[protein]-cysteine methyltransferase
MDGLEQPMLFQLPDDDTLYAGLLSRDASYDGRAYVGVTSTRIFCRLTCPARKPKRENCRFFDSVFACMDAGFRACKRCSPLAPAADSDPKIKLLLDALDKRPDHRWSEPDIQAMGLDPSTMRRSFKRHFGMTFLEMARLRRLRDGFETISSGGRIIDAQLESGFESASGFRAAFARLLGQSPASFSGKERLKADWIETPLGGMIAIADRHSLHLLEFVERKALAAEIKKLQLGAKGEIGIGRYPPTEQVAEELARYFGGSGAHFSTPLTLHGTPFTKDVWTELRKIPAGETRSYSELARILGNPAAVRAVARANGANQLAIVIPCHRVIGADGSLTGYAGGLWRKQKLIDLELAYAAARHKTGNTRNVAS